MVRRGATRCCAGVLACGSGVARLGELPAGEQRLTLLRELTGRLVDVCGPHAHQCAYAALLDLRLQPRLALAALAHLTHLPQRRLQLARRLARLERGARLVRRRRARLGGGGPVLLPGARPPPTRRARLQRTDLGAELHQDVARVHRVRGVQPPLRAEAARGRVVRVEPSHSRQHLCAPRRELRIRRQSKVAVKAADGEAAHRVANLLLERVDLLDEPLHHRVDGRVVEALDLVRLQRDAALHLLERALDPLADLDLLANGGVFLERDVHIDTAGRHAPRHPTHHLVEGRECRDSCAKVAGSQEQLDDLPVARLSVRCRLGQRVNCRLRLLLPPGEVHSRRSTRLSQGVAALIAAAANSARGRAATSCEVAGMR
jgi:hypothetical protein